MDCAGEGSTKCRWCDRTCYDELFPWHFTMLLWSCHAVTPRVTCPWHHQPPHDGDVSINYWCSSGWSQLPLVWYLTILTSIYMIETIFKKGINAVSRHVIGTLSCKVNHQKRKSLRLGSLLTKNQTACQLSLQKSILEPSPTVVRHHFTSMSELSNITRVWWHQTMVTGWWMPMWQGSSALLCCAVTT